ncbi:hypothetical protein ACKWRH_05480 [Bradyrhizobium sp. Pa8]|uniref:hypothetical protein n=1 Tax=Bradyrhizobium sp. Pa8 TaxID=3386552 RepID=UPI00403F8CFE
MAKANECNGSRRESGSNGPDEMKDVLLGTAALIALTTSASAAALAARSHIKDFARITKIHDRNRQHGK